MGNWLIGQETMKLAKNFSDFMFTVRKSRGLTQVEAKILTGLSRSTYSIMESKAEQMTAENIEKFLLGMGLEMDDFVKYYKEVLRGNK